MEAEKRYRFLQKNKWGRIIAIVLLDVGTCLILTKYVSENWSMLRIILAVQAFYIISGGVGFVLGFAKWKKGIRPLGYLYRHNLKYLRNNMNDNCSN